MRADESRAPAILEIIVGHSTGGMYVLATPALEPLVSGLVLVSTAPDARWHPRAAYEAEQMNSRLRDASTEWNFTADGVAAGRDLLSRTP
jgi:pimeloyl-ACP methyl ester carboxylesterase